MLTGRNSFPLHSLHGYDSITYSVCRPLTNQSRANSLLINAVFPEGTTHLVFYPRALKLPGLLVLPILETLFTYFHFNVSLCSSGFP